MAPAETHHPAWDGSNLLKILDNCATHVKIQGMETLNTRSQVKPRFDFQESQSYARHQKQRFWQILTPVGLGVLLFLVLAVMIVLTANRSGAGGPVSQWADTSLIWLSLPVLGFALISLVVLIGLIYLLAKVLKILPGYTHFAQHYVTLFSTWIKAWSDRVVAPVIGVRTFRARISAIFSSLFGRKKQLR